jgi:hypothetical protein
MTTLSDFISKIEGGNDVTIAVMVGVNPSGIPTVFKVSSDGTLLMSGAANGGESSIASGAGSKVVTHGCGAVPSIINITPSDGFDSPYEVPRADIGATTFKVQFKGGILATETAYFRWEAKA